MIEIGWRNRLLSSTLSLAVASGLLLISAAATARPSDYRVAQILSIRDGSVMKSRFTGEPFGEVHFMTSQPYKARAFEIAIAVGEARYDLIHEVRSKTDDLSFLRPGDMLEVRIQEAKGRIFIKRPDGKEWKARIVKLPPSSN
jgi:hypothetical protein